MPIREQAVDQSKLGRLCDALSEIYPASKIRYLMEHGGPIVEDIEGRPKSKRGTFLYYDERNECKDVAMYSRVGFASIFEPGTVIRPAPSKSPTGGGLPKFEMHPIATGSNVWAATVELPIDSCFSYYFGIQTKIGPEEKRQDLLNPQTSYSSSSGAVVWSVFDLAPSGIKLQEKMKAIEDDQRLIRGSISDHGDFHVPSQAGERKLVVHLPQGYYDPANKDEKYSMRLFLDGGWYLDDIEVPAILDDEHTINIMLEPKEVTGLGAMRDREVEYLPHRCDLLVLPNGSDLTHLPITSNAACVRVGEKLFYVNKCGGYQNTELKLSSEILAQFDKEIVGDQSLGVPRSLTDGELKRIEEITSGELARIAKTTDSTCPYIGNIEVFAKFLSREFMDALRAQGIPSGFVERNGEHSGVTWAKTLPEAVGAIRRHHEMSPGGCDISRQEEILDSKV